MDILYSIILMLMPLIALCISVKICKPDSNKSKVFTIVVLFVSVIIALTISIYRVFLSVNNGPIELLKKVVYLMIFIMFWLSGTNDYLSQLMRRFTNINMYYLLVIKILVSLNLLKCFITLVYTKFVSNIGKYNSIEEYVGYFLIYSVVVIFINILIKALKCWKKISKIVDCFDCVGFIYILSLNTLLLALSNKNEIIFPVFIFSLTISVYSDRERIIKYYFGGDYETN